MYIQQSSTVEFTAIVLSMSQGKYMVCTRKEANIFSDTN